MTQTNVRQFARTSVALLALSLLSTSAFAQTLGAPQVTLLPDNSAIITYSAPTTPPADARLVATYNGAPVGPFLIGRSTTIFSGASLPPGSYTVQIVWSPSVASPVTSFTVPVIAGGVPGIPTLSAPVTNGNTVTLNWTALANATSYEVEVIVAETQQTLILPVGNQTSLTVPNVPFGSYVVRVRGRNVFGPGPFSNQVLVGLIETFRVRDLEISLTWNTTSDMDLHVIEPNGAHVWWRNRQGITSRLDRDNTTGFGPEVVSVLSGAGAAGVYQVFIVHYRGQPPTTSTIAVSLGVGTNNVQTKVFTRQTAAPSATTGINVALVDIKSGSIGEATGTRAVEAGDPRERAKQ